MNENNETEETEVDDFDALVDEFLQTEGKAEAAYAEEETEEKAEPVQAKTEPEEAAEEPKEALSPLLAEKARQERELRAKLEETKGSIEQQVKAAQKALVDELKANPQKFISDYGIENAGDLAAHFYAADLGDDAPPELKELLSGNEIDKKFAAMEARLAEAELQREHAAIEARNQATIDQYNGFLSSVPAETLPYFAAEASHDQAETLAAMAEVADHMYQQNGKFPSAVEVAQLIEKQISSTAARYAAINKPNVEQTQKAVPAKKKPSQTLSTEQQGSSANSSAEGEDELFEDALKMLEGMM